MHRFEKKLNNYHQRGPAKMFGGQQKCFLSPAVAIDGPVKNLASKQHKYSITK